MNSSFKTTEMYSLNSAREQNPKSGFQQASPGASAGAAALLSLLGVLWALADVLFVPKLATHL